MIDVIITTYNNQDCIRECLRSIPSHIAGIEVRIIVSDDCSVDNTVEIAKDFEPFLTSHLTILTQDCNQGIGVNRKRALEYSSAEYFMFIDADDTLQCVSADKDLKSKIKNNQIVLLDRQIPARGPTNKQLANGLLQYEPKCSNPMTELISLYASNNSFVSECWGIIFPKSLIQHLGISFEPLMAYEDILFMTQILQYAPTWAITSSILYKKSSTIGLSKTFTPSMFVSCLHATDKIMNLLEASNVYVQHQDYTRIVQSVMFDQLAPLTCSFRNEVDQLYPNAHLTYPLYDKHNPYSNGSCNLSRRLADYADAIKSSVEHCLSTSSSSTYYIWYLTFHTLAFARLIKNSRRHSQISIIDDHRQGKSIPLYSTQLNNSDLVDYESYATIVPAAQLEIDANGSTVVSVSTNQDVCKSIDIRMHYIRNPKHHFITYQLPSL